ncbi:hypothetical protein [Dyella subtropica]|uniref:hypothetical protein n=1 Tax=Dyella subtropica TaxID=2992127 RepID=UPI00225177B9|nr:hypothetical protein [Dyella subtropica]
MRHLPNRSFKKLAAIALLAGMAVVSTTAMAAHRTTGLGQSWPNAQDVSSSPRWHVYVFERDGIRYIQINDLHGKVRAAFAASSGNFLVLPIGADAASLATPQDPLPAPASKTGEIVYHDDAVQVLVAPQANGTIRTFAAESTCTDPVECSSRVN